MSVPAMEIYGSRRGTMENRLAFEVTRSRSDELIGRPSDADRYQAGLPNQAAGFKQNI